MARHYFTVITIHPYYGKQTKTFSIKQAHEANQFFKQCCNSGCTYVQLDYCSHYPNGTLTYQGKCSWGDASALY